MSQNQLFSLLIVLIALLIFCGMFTFLYRYYVVSTGKEYEQGEEDGDILLDGLEKEKAEKKISSKVGRVVSKSVSTILLLLCFAFLAFGIYGKLANDDIPFGNFTVLVIGSGSMSEKNADNTYLVDNELDNQFDTGDLIMISKVAQEDIALYDVVAFKNYEGYTIVHRIREIHEVYDEEGNLTDDTYYITRGDSNNVDDNYYADGANVLYYSNIIGRYNNWRIRYIGNFIYFLQSYQGWITIIALLYCLFIFDHYTDKLSKYEEDRFRLLLSRLGVSLPEKGKVPPFQFNIDRLYLTGYAYYFENGVYKSTDNKTPNCVPVGHMLMIKANYAWLTNIETMEVAPVVDINPYLAAPIEEEVKKKRKKKDKSNKEEN